MNILRHSIALAFLVALGTVSCKKDINQVNPPKTDSTAIAGFRDSSLLVKSISKALYDSATGAVLDSSTEYYFYDTINRKIIISLVPISNSAQSYDGIEFNYNNSGLLINITTKTIATPQVGDVYTANYTYDANNVLASAAVVDFGGDNYSITFNKINLASGGYALSWIDTSHASGSPDSISHLVEFDGNGKLLDYNYALGNKLYWADSVQYNIAGSTEKVLHTDFFYQNPPYANPDSLSTYTAYDFLSRDAKGDQLYNLNQILFHGMAEMPHSIFSYGALDEIEEYGYQYSKFPAVSTKISRLDQGSGGRYIVNFNSSPQYDNSNRLVKYRFFFPDAQLDYAEWVVSYYK